MDSLRSALSIVPSGTAATIIVGHALLTKLMMTAMFRLKLTMKSTPKAECTKIACNFLAWTRATGDCKIVTCTHPSPQPFS